MLLIVDTLYDLQVMYQVSSGYRPIVSFVGCWFQVFVAKLRSSAISVG